MKLAPTGRILSTVDGRDLALERVYRAPIEDVWASITESERTARWFGSWTGDARPGGIIHVNMLFEEGDNVSTVRIVDCDAPTYLALNTMNDEYGDWRLEVRLSESDGVTTLVLIHHLDDGIPVEYVGPGWEYYLDMLTATRDNLPLPNFDDYLEAQQTYYAELQPE